MPNNHKLKKGRFISAHSHSRLVPRQGDNVEEKQSMEGQAGGSSSNSQPPSPFGPTQPTRLLGGSTHIRGKASTIRTQIYDKLM